MISTLVNWKGKLGYEEKQKLFRESFLLFDQYIFHCVTSNHFLKKSLLVFCFFDLICIFSTFFVNETTLRMGMVLKFLSALFPKVE